MKEKTAIVLDFLPSGYPGDRRPEPIAQLIGEEFFSLLEAVVKQDKKLSTGDRVSLDPEQENEIKLIKRKMKKQDLTNYSRSSLEDTIENIIKVHEQKFVQFFNKATMITPRMHQFELLPGIGKKHVNNILTVRREKPFESFKDIEERVKLMPDIVKLIKKRVLEEMEGNEKYYLFIPGPVQHRRY